MAKNEKTFNEQNMRKIIRILSGLKSQADELANKCVLPYDDAKVYSKDDICFYNGTLYRAKTVTLGNTPSPESTYFEMLDGVEEEIDAQYIETLMSTVSAETWDYLKDFINNDIISTTHAWSSSRAYTEIQNAIQTAKDYTLEKVANSSTGSYVIATSTDEVVDDKHLFLISNGSNYDIYALVNGAPTKIGDTSVSLDGLLTEATAESTYLKQTNAASTYATITAVDGLTTAVGEKVNKSSVLNSMSNTPTADQVYNAQVMNTELAKKANAFNIHEITDASCKTAYLAMDIPASNSISGKTTRLYFSDNIKDEIGLQVWGVDGTLESDARLSSKAIKPGDVAELNWINCTNESDVSGMEVLIKNDDKTITDCGAFYAYKQTTGGISYNVNILAKIGNIHLITPSDKSVYLNSKEICTKAVVDTSGTATIIPEGTTGRVVYKVINGICYVSVSDIADGLNGLGVCSITGLPTPSMFVDVALEYGGTYVGSIYCDPGATTFGVHKSTTTNGCGSFSYPVAES